MFALSSLIARLGSLRSVIAVALLVASLFYLTAGLHSAWQIDAPGLINSGRAFGRDFVAFWAASRLALAGAPEAVFDVARLHAVEMQAVGAAIGATAWHYPPTFLLVVLPLALLPYMAALFLWLFVPLVAFCLVARRLYRAPALAWLLPLFPSVALCLVSGQNGFLTALLIAAALLALDRRPLLAGLCFGLLTYKPHLALLVFPALAFGRYWHALAAAIATALAFALLSIVVFGTAPWHAFFANLAFVREVIDIGAIPWQRMPTVFVAARLAGIEPGVARLIQAAVAVATLAVVCGIWSRCPSLRLRGAALIVALPLATPYAFDYDLVVLALAIGWLVEEAVIDGWKRGEAPLLGVAWASPALFWPLIDYGGPPLMPLLFAILLIMIWRRAAVMDRPAGAAATIAA